MNTTARTIQDFQDKAQNKASEIKDDVRDTERDLERKVKSVIYDLAGDLKRKAADAQSYISNGSEVVKDKTLEANEEFVKCVKEHPWKSVGAAVLVGYLLGKML